MPFAHHNNGPDNSEVWWWYGHGSTGINAYVYKRGRRSYEVAFKTSQPDLYSAPAPQHFTSRRKARKYAKDNV